MTGLSLTDLIDINLLQKIQDEFSKYTGMAALTTDADGFPLTEGSAFTDFCMKYTRQSELGYQRCIQSDKNAALKALETGEPVVYVCHAGMADFASPIMLGDKLLGCFLGGQVRISSKIDEEALKETAKELGIQYEGYYEAMQEINVVNKKELQKAAKFLGIVANVLSEMAYQNYMSIDKFRNLERAARSQSHFLMDLSSDLQANMNQWITALQGAVREENVDAVMGVIHTMLTNGRTTYSIIGDIVDYMKFSDGNVALYEASYSIYDVVQMVTELEAEGAGKKNIRILYNISKEVPDMLFGDGGRIGQILTKLITHAIEIKEEIEKETVLEISVFCKKESYAQVLTIEVRDSGKMLEEDEVKALNEYFSRGILRMQDNGETKEYELSIIDLFVRQMQGEILIKNSEDGLKFSIALPQLEVSES